MQGTCAHGSLPGRLPGRPAHARLASAASSLCGCSHGHLAAQCGARKRPRCSLQVQAIADERVQAAVLEEALAASRISDSVELDAAQAERQKLQQLLNRCGARAGLPRLIACGSVCALRYIVRACGSALASLTVNAALCSAKALFVRICSVPAGGAALGECKTWCSLS